MAARGPRGHRLPAQRLSPRGPTWPETCGSGAPTGGAPRTAWDRRGTRKGPTAGPGKVIRGGSYLCHESYGNRYRVAARSSNTSESAGGNLGFRLSATSNDDRQADMRIIYVDVDTLRADHTQPYGTSGR